MTSTTALFGHPSIETQLSIVRSRCSSYSLVASWMMWRQKENWSDGASPAHPIGLPTTRCRTRVQRLIPSKSDRFELSGPDPQLQFHLCFFLLERTWVAFLESFRLMRSSGQASDVFPVHERAKFGTSILQCLAFFSQVTRNDGIISSSPSQS